MASVRLTQPIRNRIYANAKELFTKRRSQEMSLQEEMRMTAEAMMFGARVDFFVSRHRTLRRALAEWPQLWELVPADLRLKYGERREQPAVGDYDTSYLTGAIVASKMVNATIP